MRPSQVVSLFYVWKGMNARCYHKGNSSYPDYGGRGITVCDRWRRSFDYFVEDMGPRANRLTTLDRENNDGPYSPDNCRWATWHAQAANKRSNRKLTAHGETLHLAEWARRLGCTPLAIHYRIKGGMSVDDAVSIPVPERPNGKLTLVQAQAIRAAYPGRTMQALADEFSVSKKTVLNIIHGKIFRDDPNLSVSRP
jgi:hypothetical protein